ncbi:hypothetical protein [Nocardioides piscis]|uniref:Uncharacterized protein n=1 Tax=Nocardioides piscis TaxID=2714938 RepID=A0A6G7YF80_9ACTN|nr:hypothetical protein [Nocardioides piscis]QIK75430.1 hypothetical protein G7071_08260 [Nocardioides piscis]
MTTAHGTVDRQTHEQPGLRTLGEVLAHSSGPLLVAGGLSWVATYVVEVLIGVTLGEEVHASPELSSSVLVWLWPATFMAAIFFLGAGLLGVGMQVGRRARVLAASGGLLALVACGASLVNLVKLTGVVGEMDASDRLGFLGVIGVLGGSVVLGVAAIRGRALSPNVRLTLALLPLSFVPAIIATIPLEGVAPDYVVADLPFPVVGLVLAVVGLALSRQRD